MARETITRYIDDSTGEEIPEGQGVELSITLLGNGKKYEMDLARSSFDRAFSGWEQSAKEIKRRGRKPGSTNKPKSTADKS